MNFLIHSFIVHGSMCPGLKNPSNGFVKLSNKLNSGSQAKYVCASGFILKGVNVRVCQSNGKWSGHPPICKRKSLFLLIS